MPIAHIFVDTNAWDQLHFDFTHQTFVAMAKVASEDDIILVLPEITEHEIRTHIDDHIKKASGALGGHAVLNNTVSGKNRFAGVRDEVFSAFETYLTSLKTIRIPISAESMRCALDQHKVLQPPFTTKKPNEFKDAFAFYALKEWVAGLTYEPNLIACTTDEGFAEALEELCSEKVYKSISQALGYVSKTKDSFATLLKAIDSYFSPHQTHLESEITRYLEKVEHTFDDHSYPDYELSVKSIKFANSGFEILSITDGEAETSRKFKITYEITAYRDKEVWDPVDRENVSIGAEEFGPKELEMEGAIDFNVQYNEDMTISGWFYEIVLEEDSVELESSEDDWTYDRGNDDDWEER